MDGTGKGCLAVTSRRIAEGRTLDNRRELWRDDGAAARGLRHGHISRSSASRLHMARFAKGDPVPRTKSSRSCGRLPGTDRLGVRQMDVELSETFEALGT